MYNKYMDINQYSLVGSHFAELSAALLNIDRDEVSKAIGVLRVARENKKNVWIVGNGGSAATASHFCNDLVKMAGIRAFAIPDMTPLVTAFGNDDGWKFMFSHAIDVFFDPGDVIVAISCGGRSENVVDATKYIKNAIVITGNDYDTPLAHSGPAAIILAGSKDITIQEDMHLAVCHAITKALK